MTALRCKVIHKDTARKQITLLLPGHMHMHTHTNARTHTQCYECKSRVIAHCSRQALRRTCPILVDSRCLWRQLNLAVFFLQGFCGKLMTGDRVGDND